MFRPINTLQWVNSIGREPSASDEKPIYSARAHHFAQRVVNRPSRSRKRNLPRRSRSSPLARRNLTRALVTPIEDTKEWRGERLQSQLFLDLFYSCEKFPEPANPGNLLLCFRKRHGGRRPPSPATDVLGNATLRTDGGVIANLNVPNDTSLTANQDTLTDPDTAGNSGLRCDDGILADHNVVRDLHEIVDLCSFLDPGSAKTSAIDSRIGADLHIIVDLYNSEL